MIFRRDDHPVRVCPPTLALAGDQVHAGRPFTGCTLRPLTGQGFAPRHAAGSPVTRGSGTGSCHRPGRPAAITRHIAPVMAALAIYAVTAALLKDRTDTQAPPPATPDQAPPETWDDPADRTGDQAPASRSPLAPEPPGHATHWPWRRRHQARSYRVHQRTR